MGFLRKILAFFASLFGAKTAESKSDEHIDESSVAPVENVLNDEDVNLIGFHPQLVKHLKLDHQNLLSAYTSMLEDAKAHKFTTIADQLSKFKSEFGAHLNTENIKFYGYLEQNLKQSSQEFREMREYRRKMRKIERTVNIFLDFWIENKVDQSNLQRFLDESGGIASALVSRIQSEEESLYPIYENNVAAT